MNDEELKRAIVRNDVEYLERRRNEYDLNGRFADEDEDSLLLYSISDPGSEAYRFFLERGADRMAVNAQGEHLLHAIVYSGDVGRLRFVDENYPEAIRSLLDRPSSDGTTPLMLSVLLDHGAICSYLMEMGADVNLADHENNAPIHPACFSGRMDLVKSLVEHGADLHAKTNKGNYPLALAVNGDHRELARYLFPLFYA